MKRKQTITVTSDELNTILAALEFHAEDYEHAARKDPLLSRHERDEYREKARRAENATGGG